MAALEASVRDQISLYVERYISAGELGDRLPGTDALDAASDAPWELVMVTTGLLAEFENGDRTEDGVREALRPYASWAIDRAQLSQVTTSAGLRLRVRVGAGTPLLEVRV